MKFSLEAYEVITSLLTEKIKGIKLSMKNESGDDLESSKNVLQDYLDALSEIDSIGTY